MAAGEIPFAVASLLKSASQASKLPLPHVAAKTGEPVTIRAPIATARTREEDVIGVRNPAIDFESMLHDGKTCRVRPRPKQGCESWRGVESFNNSRPMTPKV